MIRRLFSCLLLSLGVAACAATPSAYEKSSVVKYLFPETETLFPETETKEGFSFYSLEPGFRFFDWLRPSRFYIRAESYVPPPPNASRPIVFKELARARVGRTTITFQIADGLPVNANESEYISAWGRMVANAIDETTRTVMPDRLLNILITLNIVGDNDKIDHIYKDDARIDAAAFTFVVGKNDILERGVTLGNSAFAAIIIHETYHAIEIVREDRVRSYGILKALFASSDAWKDHVKEYALGEVAAEIFSQCALLHFSDSPGQPTPIYSREEIVRSEEERQKDIETIERVIVGEDYSKLTRARLPLLGYYVGQILWLEYVGNIRNINKDHPDAKRVQAICKPEYLSRSLNLMNLIDFLIKNNKS